MRKLLGYCAHLASCRLHEVAVWGLRDMECFQVAHPPLVNMSDQFGSFPMRFPDVAPRLSAAIDWGRERAQHATWIAGILGLGRVAGRGR